MTTFARVPYPDAEGITEDLIRAVVVEFYRRVRLDEEIGPIFDAHVENWDIHLSRMADFWSSILLWSGRYTGKPMVRHRAIPELAYGHFDRWIELFEATLRDLCAAREAEVFLARALRMREAMIKVLRLDGSQF